MMRYQYRASITLAALFLLLGCSETEQHSGLDSLGANQKSFLINMTPEDEQIKVQAQSQELSISDFKLSQVQFAKLKGSKPATKDAGSGYYVLGTSEQAPSVTVSFETKLDGTVCKGTGQKVLLGASMEVVCDMQGSAPAQTTKPSDTMSSQANTTLEQFAKACTEQGGLYSSKICSISTTENFQIDSARVEFNKTYASSHQNINNLAMFRKLQLACLSEFFKLSGDQQSCQCSENKELNLWEQATSFQLQQKSADQICLDNSENSTQKNESSMTNFTAPTRAEIESANEKLCQALDEYNMLNYGTCTCERSDFSAKDVSLNENPLEFMYQCTGEYGAVMTANSCYRYGLEPFGEGCDCPSSGGAELPIQDGEHEYSYIYRCMERKNMLIE